LNSDQRRFKANYLQNGLKAEQKWIFSYETPSIAFHIAVILVWVVFLIKNSLILDQIWSMLVNMTL